MAVVEGPTYLGALMAFRGFGAEIAVVPLDDDGLQVGRARRRLAGGLRPKLLYTIPDHQNPAGVSLSTERREALVELARRYGFLVFEDVAYREPRFRRGRAAEPLVARPGRRRTGGDDVEDVLPRCPARLGGGAGGGLGAARLGEAEHRPVRRRARAEAVRGVRAPRARSTSSSPRRARCTGASATECWPRSSGRCRRASGGRRRGRLLLVADAPRGGRRGRRSRGRAVERGGWRSCPASPFYPDGRGGDNVRLSFSLVDESQIEAGHRRLAKLV